MDDDDLSPEDHPTTDDSGFWGSIGTGFTGLVFVAVFLALAGAIVYALLHWL